MQPLGVCEKCGAPQKPNTRFCAKCGTPYSNAPVKSPVSPPPAALPKKPIQQPPIIPQPTPTHSPANIASDELSWSQWPFEEESVEFEQIGAPKFFASKAGKATSVGIYIVLALICGGGLLISSPKQFKKENPKLYIGLVVFSGFAIWEAVKKNKTTYHVMSMDRKGISIVEIDSEGNQTDRFACPWRQIQKSELNTKLKMVGRTPTFPGELTIQPSQSVSQPPYIFILGSYSTEVEKKLIRILSIVGEGLELNTMAKKMHYHYLP